MNSSLQLLVILTLISCLFGGSLSHPIDDKEILALRTGSAIGQPSIVGILRHNESPSNTATHATSEDSSIKKEDIQSTSSMMDTTNKSKEPQTNTGGVKTEEPKAIVEEAKIEQPITIVEGTNVEETKTIAEEAKIEEPKTIVGESKIEEPKTIIEGTKIDEPLNNVNRAAKSEENSEVKAKESSTEEPNTKEDSRQSENMDITKAKTQKRSAENDEEDDSTKNGDNADSDMSADRETDSEEEKKSSHTSSHMDTDMASDRNVNNKPTYEDMNEGSKNISKSKNMAKRSVENEKNETSQDSHNDNDKHADSDGGTSLSDQASKAGILKYDSSNSDKENGTAASDEDSNYYEGETLNFYHDDDNRNKDDQIDLMFDDVMILGEVPNGNDEHSNDTRRVKRSSDWEAKLSTLREKLEKNETTESPRQENMDVTDEGLVATSQWDDIHRTGKPTINEEATVAVKDKELNHTSPNSHETELSSKEASHNTEGSDDYRRQKRSPDIIVVIKKKIGNATTTELPNDANMDTTNSSMTEMNNSHMTEKPTFDETSPTISDDESSNKDINKDESEHSAEETSQKADHRRAKRSSENKETIDKDMIETHQEKDSQIADKPTFDETSPAISDDKFTNKYVNKNESELSSIATSQKVDHRRAKRSSGTIIVINKKTENADSTEVSTEKTNTAIDKDITETPVDDSRITEKPTFDEITSETDEKKSESMKLNENTHSFSAYTTNYRRAKRSNDWEVKIVTLRKKIEDSETTELPVKQNIESQNESLNETSVSTRSPIGDMPEYDESFPLKNGNETLNKN